MKREFLQGLKLEKEVVDQIMAEHGKGVETHKAQAEAAGKDRDALKGQLEEVSKKLKAFDGVDVAKLKDEIDLLKTSMTAKETEFAAQIADRDFQAALASEITAAKGKSAKAVAALLDVGALKASKNQKEDIAAALKALQTSDAYLFGETQTQETTPARVKTGGTHTEPTGASADPFVAAAMKGAGLAAGKEG